MNILNGLLADEKKIVSWLIESAEDGKTTYSIKIPNIRLDCDIQKVLSTLPYRFVSFKSKVGTLNVGLVESIRIESDPEKESGDILTVTVHPEVLKLLLGVVPASVSFTIG